MVLVVVVATTLVACGDDEVCVSASTSASTSSLLSSGCGPDRVEIAPNEADERFVMDRALSIGEVGQLAVLAVEESGDDELVALAEAYGVETGDLLDAFGRFERKWDLPETVYEDAPVGIDLREYAGDDDYAVLEDLSGTEFDESWIEVMLGRADDQIDVTEDLLQEGDHLGLRSAAERWISANEALLDGLQDLQRDLSS